MRRDMAEFLKLMKGDNAVACLGSRALLTLLACQVSENPLLVAAVTSAPEALQRVEEHRPRFLITSDLLEEGCGVDLVVQVKALWPETRTLLLITQEQRIQRLRAAIEANCDGICRESRIGQGTFLDAMRTVASGALYLDRDLASQLRRCAEGSAIPSDPLSQREVEVLQQLLNGFTNQAIGERLFISADTVKSHIRNIVLKLQARDRTHAAVIGLWLGLVDWPEPYRHR